MNKNHWRRSLRHILIKQFLRMMKTEEVRRHLKLITPEYGNIREEVSHSSDPYREAADSTKDLTVTPPIFVTGRFRSGSTLLWNIFRHLPGCTAYYEPFNERRWFSLESRGSHTDGTHEGVSEYWSEYTGLGELSRYYREDWIRYGLYMNEKSFDLGMKSYINGLAAGSQGRAVLQFNRVDFRLPWLKANFPESPIVHIFRNPRDQWCSTLRDIHSYPADSASSKGFVDRFYLQMWVRDLCQQFPFLEQYRSAHQYYNFYFLWRLSYSFGQQYADVSVAMEELTNKPVEQTRHILDAVGWDGDSRIPDLSFVTPSVSRWQMYATDEWFSAIEDECDAILEDFLR